MLNGTVTQLLRDQRLGFLQPSLGGISILFRAVAVEGAYFDDLSEGQAVTYTLERDMEGRGARAVRVRPLTSPQPVTAVDG